MANKIKILMPGPIKFDFVKEGIKYYLEKIKPFIMLEIILPKIKIVKITKEEKIKKEEKILRKYLVLNKEYLIILDEKGKFFKSIELAKKVENLITNFSTITFIIGGEEGISENLKKEAKEIWSLSNLTLNHEIALLVLMEALYRSFTIINKIPYHRG